MEIEDYPQEQWPDPLRNVIMARSPQRAFWDPTVGAKMIGPACLPVVRALVADNVAHPVSRTKAMDVLVTLRDPGGKCYSRQ